MNSVQSSCLCLYFSLNKNMETLLSKSETSNGNMLAMTEFSSVERPSDDKIILDVLTRVKNGDFSVRMPLDEVGRFGAVCTTLNEIIDLNERMTLEFTRAANTIGKQGKLTQRLELPIPKVHGEAE